MQITSSAPTLPQHVLHYRQRNGVDGARCAKVLFWYMLLSPSLLVILGFWIVPMFWSIYYSFTRGGMLGKHPFIGFQNYVMPSNIQSSYRH